MIDTPSNDLDGCALYHRTGLIDKLFGLPTFTLPRASDEIECCQQTASG